MPTDYMMDLTYLFQKGVIGWTAGAREAYSAYAQSHNLQQILIAVNSKKHKPKKPVKFEEMFPVHHELMHLGVPPAKKLKMGFDRMMTALRKM